LRKGDYERKYYRIEKCDGSRGGTTYKKRNMKIKGGSGKAEKKVGKRGGKYLMRGGVQGLQTRRNIRRKLGTRNLSHGVERPKKIYKEPHQRRL